MAVNENIEYIKEELSAQEKFLESFIKVEKFYKKYKKPFKYTAIAAFLAILGYLGYEYKKEYDLKISNKAYIQLLKNPDNKELIELLKDKNPKLYELFLYKLSLQKEDIKGFEILKDSSDEILKDLSSYHIGVIKKSQPLLKDYSINKENIFTDYALLDRAYMDYENNKTDSAHQTLSKIDSASDAYVFSLLLKHYGVSK